MEIMNINWSIDSVSRENMAVTSTRKQKCSQENDGAGAATLAGPLVGDTRSIKKGRSNDQEKEGRMEEGCRDDVGAGATTLAGPSADDNIGSGGAPTSGMLKGPPPPPQGGGAMGG
ncbi:hypothetical protein ACHAXH_001226, partial [Discostella pseudostelligera]